MRFTNCTVSACQLPYSPIVPEVSTTMTTSSAHTGMSGKNTLRTKIDLPTFIDRGFVMSQNARRCWPGRPTGFLGSCHDCPSSSLISSRWELNYDITHTAMPRIFISYRHQDGAGWAGHVHKRLKDHFGDEGVFFDSLKIRAGAEWAKALDDNLAASDALVALIGRNWGTVTDDTGRARLGQSDDRLTMEIVA